MQVHEEIKHNNSSLHKQFKSSEDRLVHGYGSEREN